MKKLRAIVIWIVLLGFISNLFGAAPTISGAPTDLTVIKNTESNLDLSAVSLADTDNNTLTLTLILSTGTFSTPTDGSGVSVTETKVSDTLITLVGTPADINTYLDTTTNIKYTPVNDASGNDQGKIYLLVEDGDSTSVLQAFYPFEDNANDFSGNSRDLTNVGTASYGTGQIGKSYSFNSSNDLSNTSTGLSGGSGTVSFWLYQADLSATSSLVIMSSSTSGTSSGFDAYIQSDDGLRVGESPDYDIINSPGLRDSTWHHIAATFSTSNTLKIYIDGVLQSVNTDASEDINLQTYLYVGDWATNCCVWTGEMDDLRIYNSVLTSDQVTALYNLRNAPSINIDITNTAPTISGAPSDVTVTEDTESNVDLSAITLADANGDSITLTLTVATGVFSTPVDGSGVSVAETKVSNTQITLAGTPVNINTYLDTDSNIKYTPSSNASGDNQATITISATDGTDSLASNPTVNIDITAVNDSQSVSSAPSDITVTEDVESNIDLDSTQFADVDGDTLSVILQVGAGTFSTPVDGSANSVTETKLSDIQIKLEGTPTNLNTYIGTASNIKYTSDTNVNGDNFTTLKIKISDGADISSGLVAHY